MPDPTLDQIHVAKINELRASEPDLRVMLTKAIAQRDACLEVLNKVADTLNFSSFDPKEPMYSAVLAVIARCKRAS